MKLYFSPGACSLSPHIVLQEAGLSFEKVRADTKTKVMDGGGDFRTVNPLGYVPALVLDDGTLLTEGPPSCSTSLTRCRRRSSRRPTARSSARRCSRG